MSTGPGPTVRRRQLGNTLRRYRTEAGMSVQQVADQLLCSPAKVSRIETGQRNATLRDVRDLSNIYGIADDMVRETLMSMARESRERGWWQTLSLPPALEILIGMERTATRISAFEILTVPGLLQTRDYADALLRRWIPDEPERRHSAVDIRMRRQRILKEPSAPRLRMILDEAALHRIVGGRAVMRDQLRHLITLIDTSALDLRIIPFAAGAHLGMLNGFTLLEFDEGDPAPVQPVVYVEYQEMAKYFDQPAEVDQYARTFASLTGQSLTSAESRRVVAATAEALR